MKLGSALIVSLLLFISSAVNILADDSKPNKEWRKFTVMEFSVKKDSEIGMYRRTRYKNGEYMTSVELEGIKYHHLFVLPARFDLYSGGTMSPSERRDIFLSSKFIFEYAIMALSAAYPDGPVSVPFEKTEKTVVIDKKNTKVTLTTTRTNSHEIKYNLISVVTEDAEVGGIWDNELIDPLPDDFSIVGWNHASPVQINTLLEARSVRLMPTVDKK